MLLPPWKKTQRVVFRPGLKGAHFSLMQSHPAAEGHGVCICPKDCRDYNTDHLHPTA